MKNRIRFLFLLAVTAVSAPVLTPSPALAGPVVKIENGQLLADFDRDGQYQPFVVKGVGYGYTPVGAFYGESGYCFYSGLTNGKPQFDCSGEQEYENEAALDRDLPLIKKMNANTIRTWGRITPQLTKKANEFGLKIIAGYWVPHNLDFVNDDLSGLKKDILRYVETYKDDPSILMWQIGNAVGSELCSYPQARACDRKAQAEALYDFLNDVAGGIKKIEGEAGHPVMIAHADLGLIGKAASDERLTNIDVHGCDIYRGPAFGTDQDGFFEQYPQRSQKPVLVTEFGSDVWFVTDAAHPENGVERQDLQAAELAASWDKITANHVSQGGQALGGVIAVYADGWWKLSGEWNASAAVHDYGFVPNFHSGPDGYVNPEWIGIVGLVPGDEPGDLETVAPRLAVDVMTYKFSEQPQQRPAVNIRKGTLRKDVSWNYTIGYHFKPKVPGTVTQLGGLFNGNKNVSLWDRDSGELLRQVRITGRNEWIYEAIEPVEVNPEHSYTVAVFADGDGAAEIFGIDPFPQAYGDILIEGSTFVVGDERPQTVIAEHFYGLADIVFVPESTAENHFPVITSPPKAEPQRITAGRTATITVKAEDEDGDALTYTWHTTGGSIKGDGPQAVLTAPEVKVPAAHNVTVFIEDGRGGFTYDHVLVEILPSKEEPGPEAREEGTHE